MGPLECEKAIQMAQSSATKLSHSITKQCLTLLADNSKGGGGQPEVLLEEH